MNTFSHVINIALLLLAFSASAQPERRLTLYFEFNQFRLTTTEQRKLDALAEPMQVVRIAGHTDPVGTREANFRLSFQRAQEVQRLLNSRMYTNAPLFSYGEDSLISQDDALNRRVDIFYRDSISTQDTVTLQGVDSSYMDSVSADSLQPVLIRQSFERIYFLPDQAVIDPASYQHVAALLRFVQAYPDQLIEIRGHVNMSRRFNRFPENGFYQRMEKLSEDRARLIYEILVEKGIDPDRLRYRGMGNREMVVPDARTEAEMRRNMRVEVVVFEK